MKLKSILTWKNFILISMFSLPTVSSLNLSYSETELNPISSQNATYIDDFFDLGTIVQYAPAIIEIFDKGDVFLDNADKLLSDAGELFDGLFPDKIDYSTHFDKVYQNQHEISKGINILKNNNDKILSLMKKNQNELKDYLDETERNLIVSFKQEDLDEKIISMQSKMARINEYTTPVSRIDNWKEIHNDYFADLTFFMSKEWRHGELLLVPVLIDFYLLNEYQRDSAQFEGNKKALTNYFNKLLDNIQESYVTREKLYNKTLKKLCYDIGRARGAKYLIYGNQIIGMNNYNNLKFQENHWRPLHAEYSEDVKTSILKNTQLLQNLSRDRNGMYTIAIVLENYFKSNNYKRT